MLSLGCGSWLIDRWAACGVLHGGWELRAGRVWGVGASCLEGQSFMCRSKDVALTVLIDRWAASWSFYPIMLVFLPPLCCTHIP